MLSIDDLTAKQILNISEKAYFFEKNPTDLYKKRFDDKILMNLFFEESTRTAMSFENAMHRLGGKVSNFHKKSSSLEKGETIYDTIATVSHYADIFVVRHPQKNIMKKIQKILKKPVINAGDGNGEHPTQALTDFYTICKHFKLMTSTISKTESSFHLSKIHYILFVGDIENSRAIHSLVQILKKISNFHIDYRPFHQKPLDEKLKTELEIDSDNWYDEKFPSLQKYDVIYYTRVHDERTTDHSSKSVKLAPSTDVLDNEKMNQVKKDAIIMHPLPRRNEISTEVDFDPRCVYFEQVQNAIYVRMAVLNSILQPSEKIKIL